MEVSHCTTNLEEEEDGTEVRHQEEATSNQPVPEGTEIPLPRINSTHYNQYNTRLTHEICKSLGVQSKCPNVQKMNACSRLDRPDLK